MKFFGWALGGIALLGLFIFLATIVFGTCNTATNLVANGQQTVYNEIKPEALLKKYMWFKSASSALDAKVATLNAFETRNADLKSQYQGVPRNKWAREDIEAYNSNVDDEADVKASYNDLASQYNAAMKEINYAFCNVGGLPQGLPDSLKGHTLQRDYKAYITN